MAGDAKPCPICDRAASLRYRPFCSRRCADIDLGRWLGEAYRLPAVEPPEEDGEAPPPGGDGTEG
jgi:uncharacterized protein